MPIADCLNIRGFTAAIRWLTSGASDQPYDTRPTWSSKIVTGLGFENPCEGGSPIIVDVKANELAANIRDITFQANQSLNYKDSRDSPYYHVFQLVFVRITGSG